MPNDTIRPANDLLAVINIFITSANESHPKDVTIKSKNFYKHEIKAHKYIHNGNALDANKNAYNGFGYQGRLHLECSLFTFFGMPIGSVRGKFLIPF